MNMKITNGTLLLYENGTFRTEEADLYIRDGLIESVGEAPADTSGYEVFDASHHLVMPGLINMHTHIHMTAMRNIADDVDFHEWLFNRVMPVEDNMPPEDAYWTSLLGSMEMFATGTTSYLDMHMFPGHTCRAARTSGIRAYVGRGLVGDDLYADDNPRFKQALDEMAEYGSDRIRFLFSPHAPYSCSPKLLEQITREAKERGMLKQIHLSESEKEVADILKEHGKTPVALLRDIGFLDEHTSLAHCVQMREDDIAIIAKSGASVITNPASNMKLGNGFAPVEQMRTQGVNVALGTDGAASNNTLNLFREMTLLSLMQKGMLRSPVAAPAQFVLETATVNAAKALSLSGKTGVIAPGACADLAFLNLDQPSLFPPNDIVSSLVYSANGSEVDHVMIGGDFVYKDRTYKTIDAEQVRFEVRKIAEKY